MPRRPISPLARLMRLAAGLAMLLPGLGCAPARLLNAVVPSSGFALDPDLAYGRLPRQQLDVYRPEAASAPRPVVLFLYGGSWQFGSRGDYRFVGQALASRGLIAMVADYRVWPEARFPTFVEDAAAAIAWARQNAGRFGGDPARVYLMGHSAGAHIAALLALDERYLAEVGLTPTALAGVIGLAGPYDFLPITDPTLKQVFDVPDLRTTQPITFAGPDAPPALLATGEQDLTVAPANSERLAARLEQSGNEVELKRYRQIGHISIALALAAPFRWLAPVLDDVARFVERTGPARVSRRETPPAGRAA